MTYSEKEILALDTDQKVFDYVIKFLKAQGEASIGGRGDNAGGWGCAYRGAKGRKCAVGCLILDNEYHQHMEGIDIKQILHRGDLERLDPFTDVICALQRLHDKKSTWHLGGGFSHQGFLSIREVAQKNNLEWEWPEEEVQKVYLQ